ncbi:MAG: hypothetical protein JJE04_10950 [Acidobacteriia bacterium]|nr:hypothetical protein [Terriglobia bacterium]
MYFAGMFARGVNNGHIIHGRVKLPSLFAFSILLGCSQREPTTPEAAAQASKPFEVTTTLAGSIRTPLGYGVVLNKKSSLARTTYLIVDPECPLALKSAKLTTVWERKEYSGEYQYAGVAEGAAKKGLTAASIAFVVLDVWGQHIQSLDHETIEDISEGPFKSEGHWRLWSENDASRFMNSFAFVRRVRLADGTIWNANEDRILATIRQKGAELTREDISTKKKAAKGPPPAASK